MAQPTIVNKFGTMTGWNRVTFNLFGRDIEGITEISYDDNVDWENVPGASRMPIGESEGNYTAKASISIYIEEARAMAAGLPAGKRLQDVLGEAIAEYEYGGKFYKDILRNLRIKNRGVEVKNGDGTISNKYELKISHIDWDQ